MSLQVNSFLKRYRINDVIDVEFNIRKELVMGCSRV